MSPVDSVSPASEPAALAVDSGQTAIRVRSRHPQYFEHSFPGAITSRALLPQLADAVVAASRLAGRPFQLVTIGTTGLTDVDNDPDQLLELCRDAGTEEVRLAHDSITSYLAALGPEPGVVVAAGTGVVTLGVGASGTQRVDGWGYLLGDCGSGYWLGRAALHHALRAYDGRGPATALTQVLIDAFPQPEGAYIELQTDPDKVRRIAGFARAVCELAATDEVAASICREAGEELALSAYAAARRVALGDDVRVCLIGGVFEAGAVRAATEAALRTRVPGVRIVAPLGEGIDGAEELARIEPGHPLASSIAIARSSGTRHLFRVQPPLRDYAWGSPTHIPHLLGRQPDGRPQAELWLGAHPSAPATVGGAGLDQVLADRPELTSTEPAAGVRAGGGPAPRGLPFLMKVLAAGRPLSLQVHPNREQAAEGYERENAAGIALGDPRRNYADREHKPELILAITPFVALCGFRAPSQAADDLAELLALTGRDGLAAEPSALAADLLGALREPDESAALRRAVRLLLSGRPAVRELAAAVVQAAHQHSGRYADTVRLAGDYGDDPGVLAMALLNRVDLAPGEALYLDAGNIHAYLGGLGIEAMAPSDNVLRGGLTPKHVDVDGLLEIVNFAALRPQFVPAQTSESDGVRMDSYWPPVSDFSVHRLLATGGPRELALTEPAMVIVTDGSLEVSAGSERLVLQRGDSAFHAAGAPLSVRAIEAPAIAYLTTVGVQR